MPSNKAEAPRMAQVTALRRPAIAPPEPGLTPAEVGAKAREIVAAYDKAAGGQA